MIILITIISFGGYFASKTVGEWGYRKRYEIQKYRSEMEYVDRMSITHIKDLKIFGFIPWVNELQDKSFYLLRNMAKKIELKYLKTDILDIILTFLKNGLAYFYIIHMTLQGELSVSEFLLYFSMVTAYTDRLSQIISELSTLRRQSLEYCTLREYLDTPEIFKFEEGIPLVVDSTKEYEIELKNVSHRYEDAPNYTLKHINLKIKQ